MYLTILLLPKITEILALFYGILILGIFISIKKLKYVNRNNPRLKIFKLILVYGKNIIEILTPLLIGLIFVCTAIFVSNSLNLGPQIISVTGTIMLFLTLINFLKTLIKKIKKME